MVPAGQLPGPRKLALSVQKILSSRFGGVRGVVVLWQDVRVTGWRKDFAPPVPVWGQPQVAGEPQPRVGQQAERLPLLIAEAAGLAAVRREARGGIWAAGLVQQTLLQDVQILPLQVTLGRVHSEPGRERSAWRRAGRLADLAASSAEERV
jgi:hypothetical protein